MESNVVTADFGLTLLVSNTGGGYFLRWFVLVPMFGPLYIGEFVRVDQ